MSNFGWVVEEYPGDPDPWHFVLYEVRCACGWFLAGAEPIMGRTGVDGVWGKCKRHGEVYAETFGIIDAAELVQ